MADTITGLLELARSTSSAAGGSSCDLREVVTEAVDLVAPGGCCVVDLPAP